MEQQIDILNELKALSPTVAAIGKVNVFTVPEGYFEYLATDILMGIKHENGFTQDTARVTGIPNGYFDTLADSILNKIKAQDTEDAAAEIEGLSPVLFNIKTEKVFETPQGYFDSLPGTVLQKIKAQEVEEDASIEIRALSPMLYSIQNENVFEVPQGYFENLSDDVLHKVKPQPKVVKMPGRSSTFFKYAVAAAFTGMMALGVFKFTSVNDKTVLPDYVTAGLQIKDVDKELANISDDEIVNFLEANGTDVKTAMVANSIDKNELPSQDDYLLDDEALDKYLNSINVEDLKN
ncbi:MAG: hypothetical protein ABIN74_11180 [Ferruginibacter sp.]